MKIYFTCTTAEFDKHHELYFAIRDYIVEQGHTLTRDWIGETYSRYERKITEIKDVKKVYEESISSLRKADLVIVEDTVSNFSTGHQITLALQARKPTLVLWKGPKHRQFNKMFIHGIDSELLEVAEYTENSFKEIISKFVHKFEKIDQENRFNLVLKSYEREYLDWAKFNRDESRTQVIKKALKQIIDDDKEYQEFLRKLSTDNH